MKQEEEEEEEGGDTFELDITVANPEKVGEGMSSYISYSIKTKTTMPDFKRPETTVRRRFSDFLGLHQRLSEKHIHKGRIVPPAPEKSMLGEEGEGEEEGGRADVIAVSKSSVTLLALFQVRQESSFPRVRRTVLPSSRGGGPPWKGQYFLIWKWRLSCCQCGADIVTCDLMS